jgi:hypothetical protein
MKHSVTILLLLLTTTMFGQITSDADKVRETLKGASITKQIIKTRTVFFSNTQKQDTIILTTPVGLISKSNSTLTIKTFDNRTIFNETFTTDYFVRGVFEPDTIPQIGGQEVYEAYMNNYIVSLTKTKFEAYAKSKINSFLKDVTVTKSQLKEAKSNGTIVNKDLYKSIAENPNSKVIWFPCFDCDEGARFFAYSTNKAKAVEILESD